MMPNDDYWKSLEGLVARAQLVAQSFVWGLWNNHARIIAVEGEAGIEWVTADDSQVCEVCSDNQGVYPADEESALDDIPVHPNCRCELWPV
jgi:hypothetical protein